MHVKHLILFVVGVIGIIVSLIELLSTKVVRADEELSGIAISTIIFLMIGVAGLALFVVALVLHKKGKKNRKAVEDFY